MSGDKSAQRGSYVGCIAGAQPQVECLDGITAVGFIEATVDFTHEAAPGMHSALVRATKPSGYGTKPRMDASTELVTGPTA